MGPQRGHEEVRGEEMEVEALEHLQCTDTVIIWGNIAEVFENEENRPDSPESRFCYI